MIAVLMGGNSSEREVSLASGLAVYQAFKKQNIDCFAFDWSGDNLGELWQKKFSQIFIILHGRGGEDGAIQAQLEAKGIPYTGSDPASSKNAMNKTITKTIWQADNLPLADSITVRKNEPIKPINFQLPWAVKPVSEGSSIGITKVKKAENLNQALELAWQYDDEVLIEQWIAGDEYTVAILDGHALPAVKIITQHDFYDYQAKYQSEETRYVCPCGLSKETERKLQKIALKAFNSIGAKGWGRIDFIVDNNRMYLLEINTVPGMTSHSLVPMAAKAAGISFEALVLAILKAN